MIVFNSAPSGNKLVGVHNRMGMKLASKFNGMLMVKSELSELIKGVFNIKGPANTQKDSMKSHSDCTIESAEVCMLPLGRLQLLSRPRPCSPPNVLIGSHREEGGPCWDVESMLRA
eukprot:1142093-Pelagomonas_calceolata.AAC.1